MGPTDLLLPLLLLAVAGAQDIAVPSADGRFEARLASGRLEVRAADGRELWSCRHPAADVPSRFLLSDDGSTFVQVTRAFHVEEPVLRVHRHGAPVLAWSGSELELDEDDVGERWLAGEEARADLGWRHDDAWLAAHGGPSLVLRLGPAQGWSRAVDLTAGALAEPAPDPPELGVEPALPGTLPVGARSPFVESIEAPARILAGEPLAVTVTGNHPTPNWTLLGFDLEREEGRLVLVPTSEPPPDSIQLTVLEPFEREATLRGLPPGTWTIAARGHGEGLARTRVEVLGPRLLARLRTTGGFAGVNDVVELHEPGVARVVAAFDEVPGARLLHPAPAALARVRAALGALPSGDLRKRTAGASDLFQHHLLWRVDGRWFEVRVDDLTAEGEVAAAIEALRGL